MDFQEVGCRGYGLDRAGSGQGYVAGTCECGNETPGPIKCGKFLYQLKTGYGEVLKDESAMYIRGVCMCGFGNVWVFVCVGLVMCGCVYVWVW